MTFFRHALCCRSSKSVSPLQFSKSSRFRLLRLQVVRYKIGDHGGSDNREASWTSGRPGSAIVLGPFLL